MKVNALKGYIAEAKNGTRDQLQLVNFDTVRTVDTYVNIEIMIVLDSSRKAIHSLIAKQFSSRINFDARRRKANTRASSSRNSVCQ